MVLEPAPPTNSTPGGRQLRICAYVHHAWPTQRGGSEVALHRTLRWLAGRGHAVRGLVRLHQARPTEGIEYARRSLAGQHEWIDWADVVVSHLAASDGASILGAEFGRPVAHFAHNWHWLDLHPELDQRDAVVWNSHALHDAQEHRWAGPQAVLHPPVFAGEHRTTPGALTTAINLSAVKGGPLVWQLAAARPADPFLAVVGGWGYQIDADGEPWPHSSALEPIAAAAPPNVEVIPSTTDVRAVWARTRTLIVPTRRVSDVQTGESYGLVAAEALCSGIPVVATHSAGMAELLGPAGLYAAHDQPDEWHAHLDRLADPDEWTAASTAARARSAALDPTDELLELERFLLDLAGGC